MMPCPILIAKPGFSVSTREIYTKLDFVMPAAEDDSPEAQAFRAMQPDTEGLIRALHEQNLEMLLGSMGNTLECVTSPMHPEIHRLEERMETLGAARAMMSGSGPTVFGIFTDPEKAKAALEVLRAEAETLQVKQVYLTEPYQPRTGRKN